MSHSRAANPAVPRLETLGSHLLAATPGQRRTAPGQPLILLIVYAVAASLGWRLATPVIVFLIFVAVVTVTHDIVHGSLSSWY